MATFPFVGTGTIIGEFTIDDVIVKAYLVAGEYRLRGAFPYLTLDLWRRQALSATASIPELETQGRTTVLYAHEADLDALLLSVTKLDPEALVGHYNFRKKAAAVDQELSTTYRLQELALAELAQQGIGESHIQLLRARINSATSMHRVAGVCAAVYLTALLLEQAEAIT